MMSNNHNTHMVIFTTCWTVLSFCYYLLIFRLTKLEGNPYLNGTLLAAAEFLANILAGLFLSQLGLKNTLLASFTLMALSSVVYLFPLLSLALWQGIILFVLKFALTIAFAAVFFGTNALFRGDLVAILFAVCNMIARLLTMAAPSLAMGARDTTVMAVFFGLSLLGLLSAGFIRMPSSSKDKKNKKRKHDRAL